MTKFACKGWLYITLYESTNVASVRILHSEAHVHYWSVSVPAEVQEYVRSHPSLTPSQVRIHIVVYVCIKLTFL